MQYSAAPKSQKVGIMKNPRSWVMPYSVRAKVGTGKNKSIYIVSQHKTKKNALKAAERASKINIREYLGWTPVGGLSKKRWNRW